MDEKTLRKHREKLDKALAANRDDEAIKLLAVLVGAEPTNARWPHKRGDLLRKVGRRPEAVASYEQAVDVYAKTGFIARAVAMAKTVLSLDPSRTDVLARVDPQAAQDLHHKSRPGSILPAPRSASQSGSGAAKHPALVDDDVPQPSAATPSRKHPMVLDAVAAAEASPQSAPAQSEVDEPEEIIVDVEEEPAEEEVSERPAIEEDDDLAAALAEANRHATVLADDDEPAAGRPQPTLSSEAAAALAAAKRRPTLTGEAAAALAAAKKRPAGAEPTVEPRAPALLTQPIVLDEEDEATAAVSVAEQQFADSNDALTLAAAEREAKLAGEAAAALAAAKRRSAVAAPKAEPRAPAPLTQPIVLDEDDEATAVTDAAQSPTSSSSSEAATLAAAKEPARAEDVAAALAAAKRRPAGSADTAAPREAARENVPVVAVAGGAAKAPSGLNPAQPVPAQPAAAPSPVAPASAPSATAQGGAARGRVAPPLPPTAARPKAPPPLPGQPRPKPQPLTEPLTLDRLSLPPTSEEQAAVDAEAPSDLQPLAATTAANDTEASADEAAARSAEAEASVLKAESAIAVTAAAVEVALPTSVAAGSPARQPTTTGEIAKPAGLAGAAGAAFGAKQPGAAGAAFGAKQPAAAGAAKPAGVAGGEAAGAGAIGAKQQPLAAGAAKPTGVAGGGGAGAFGAKPAAAGVAKPAGVPGASGGASAAGSPAAAAPGGARPAPLGIAAPAAAKGAAAPLIAARPLGAPPAGAGNAAGAGAARAAGQDGARAPDAGVPSAPGAVPPGAAGVGGAAARGPAPGSPLAGAGGAKGAAVAGAKPPPLGSRPGASTVARGGAAAPAAPPTAAASTSDNSHSGQLWADRSVGQELPVAPVNSVQPSRHRGPTMLGAGPRIKPYEPPADEAELFSRALEAAIELKVAPDVKPNETRFSDAPPSPGVELSTAEVSDRPPAALHEEQDAIPRAAGDLSNLPLFPLFAEMPQEVLATMIQDTELVELSDGDAVVRKGDPGDALYGIVEGSVAVGVPNQTHTLTLAEGDVFGESCLLQDEPRHADVRVIGRLTALKIPRQVLLRTLRGYPKLAELLLELLTRRLLGNLLQTSPLFSEFDAEGRRELSRMFEVRRAPANTRLAITGKRMDGLYISLTGTLLVETPGQEPRIVTPGSMFGQHTLLSQLPSPSSVTARVNLVVLRLPGAAFAQVAMQYPTVVERLAELSTSDVVSVGL